MCSIIAIDKFGSTKREPARGNLPSLSRTVLDEDTYNSASSSTDFPSIEPPTAQPVDLNSSIGLDGVQYGRREQI